MGKASGQNPHAAHLRLKRRPVPPEAQQRKGLSHRLAHVPVARRRCPETHTPRTQAAQGARPGRLADRGLPAHRGPSLLTSRPHVPRCQLLWASWAPSGPRGCLVLISWWQQTGACDPALTHEMWGSLLGLGGAPGRVFSLTNGNAVDGAPPLLWTWSCRSKMLVEATAISQPGEVTTPRRHRAPDEPALEPPSSTPCWLPPHTSGSQTRSRPQAKRPTSVR